MVGRLVKRWIQGAPRMVVSRGVPNFHEVTDKVGRCGQPDAGGFAWLKEQGYEAILKLNPDSEGDDQPAVELGLRVFRYPISVWQEILWGPDEEDMYEIVNVLRCGIKVAVHCTHGQDRTGLAVMFARIADGWTWDDAFREARKFGFHESLQGLYGYALRHRTAI